MCYIIPNKNQHQYVIGIDFGHGETSVAMCSIQWEDQKLDDPTDVRIFPTGKNYAIPSILLIENQYGDDGKIINVTKYIGNPAIERYRREINNTDKVKRIFFAYFKDKPSKMESKETDGMKDSEGMKIFMEEVYKKFLHEDDRLNDNNHLVYIACPSNSEEWTESEMKKYAEIALSAGLPLVKLDDNITGIIRESRAAFIAARNNPDNLVKKGFDDGILLIDCGSSTFDLTYYSSSLSKPIDFGYEIGASEVERTLLTYLQKNHKGLELAIQQNVKKNKQYAELQLRRKKEEFYTYCYECLEVNIDLSAMTGGRIQGRVENEISHISEELINDLLSKYQEKIKDRFSDFKVNHIQNKEIKIIFLTGGASQMPFIKDIVKDVFGENILFVGKDENYSTIISRGIARAGRADLRTYNMREDIFDNPLIKDADIASQTLEKASSSIAEEIIRHIEEVYTEFASANVDTTETTINSLEEKIKKEIASINFGSFLDKSYTETLINVTNNKIKDEIEKIVHDYYPNFDIQLINTETKFRLTSDVNELGTLTTMISSSLDQIIEGFIEGLAKLAFNICAGIIAATDAVIVNITKGIINIFRNKNNQLEYEDIGEWVDTITISFKDKRTKLSYSKRLKVKNYFNEHKNTYKSNICSEIHSRLKSNEKLITLINNSGRKEIKNYVTDQIDRARLMLN